MQIEQVQNTPFNTTSPYVYAWNYVSVVKTKIITNKRFKKLQAS